MDDHGHIGEVSQNKFGTLMKIIVWNAASDIQVQFRDDHMAVVHTTYRNFQKREVKNPYDKSVYGVGYVGEGMHKTRINGEHPASYLIWVTIIQRCCREEAKEKYPAYFGRCTVCEEWFNYQNFAAWYESNRYDVDGRLHIDKDILVPGNTMYAPEFCLLVPQRVNMHFMRCKSNKTGLPRGVRRTKTGYMAVYNTQKLGVFATIDQAVKAHREAWAEAIRATVAEYQNIMPNHVYNAVMIASERIKRKGLAALTKGFFGE